MSASTLAPGPEAEFVRRVEELARRHDTASLLVLLDEQNAVYDEQSSRQVARMRGWILVLLSRRELAAAALPFVLEELDNSVEPYLVGAAALALRAFPQPRPEFAPFLLQALDNIRGRDQPLSFDRYGDYARSADATTAVRELTTTLRAIDSGDPGIPDPEECCSFRLGLTRSSWRGSERRDVSRIDNVALQDQDGAITTFRELFHGAPTIVVFFYTRCDNPLKCSLTVWKLAQVQRLLELRGVKGQVRTAAITYDPEFDLPDRLRTFGRNRGLQMDGTNHLLRTTEGITPVRSYFGLGVSYASGLVNRHRIELFLLDEQGRIARSFQRLRWDENQVVSDAVALLSDPVPPPGPQPVARVLPAAGPVAAAIVACLPKCPLCWSAYLSSVGLTAFAGHAYPLTVQLVGLLLLVHLGSVFWRARATRNWLGFGLSAAGTVAIVATIWFGADATQSGTVLLGAGALISALGRRPVRWLLRILHDRPRGAVTSRS